MPKMKKSTKKLKAELKKEEKEVKKLEAKPKGKVAYIRGEHEKVTISKTRRKAPKGQSKLHFPTFMHGTV